MHYCFGPFRFHPTQHMLYRNGEGKPLPLALNTLLLLFVSRPGELITRTDIASAVWQDQAALDIENGINGVVRRLRGMFAEAPGAESYIATVVGRGYRFTPEVRTGEDAVPAAAQAAPADLVVVPWVHRLRWPHLAALGAVAAAVLVFTLTLHSRSTAESAAIASHTVAARWSPVTFDELDDQLSAQAMSPAGDEVAIAHRGGLLIRRLDKPEAVTLPLPAGFVVGHIAWFAARDRLLLSAGTGSSAEVWVLDRSSRQLSRLLGDASHGEVAKDGQHIAFLRQSGQELWTAQADGTAAARVVTAREGETFAFVLWSADGTQLLTDQESLRGNGQSLVEKGAVAQLERVHSGTYERYDARTGKRLQQQGDLLISTATMLGSDHLVFPWQDDGRFLLRLARLGHGDIVGGALDTIFQDIDAVAVRDLSASSSGRLLSAIVDRPAHDLYVADLHGEGEHLSLGAPRRLTFHTGTSYPTAWSATGEELIFDNDTGHSRIVAQDVKTGRMRVLADTGGRAVQGQVTPDGKWVLFLRYTGEPTRVQSIDRVPLAGGPVETLYAADHILDFFCSRSAVGRCLLREEDGNRAFVYSALDPVTGKGQEVLRVPWEPNALGDWSLSPDGKTIVQPDHHGRPAIHVIPVTPSATWPSPRTLPVEGFGTVVGASWASRTGFFVQTHDGTGYQILSIQTNGRSTPIHRSSAPVWLIPDREGKRVAMPGLTPLNRNVWMATLAGVTH